MDTTQSPYYIYAFPNDITLPDRNYRLDFDGPTEYDTGAWVVMKDAGRYSRFGASWSKPHWATFEDGRRVRVQIRPAPCGSGCFCAAEWRIAQ